MQIQIQKWEKLGQIYHTHKMGEDLLTHAANPLAVHLFDDTFRVFFSARNKDNKSSVGYVDIDIIEQQIIDIAKQPIFTYGDTNSFYSHGVSIGNIYTIDKQTYMLFMGWQYEEGKHWKGDIGRLKLTEKKYLTLDLEEPFIGCDKEDSISLSYPWVMHDEGIYKMWYGSTDSWTSSNGEMIHTIKYATSSDGDTWVKHGLSIPYEVGVAQAFSRPTVTKDKHGYHMWFSYRSGDGTPYRIGYAHSNDGLTWDRKPYSGIDVSKNGWDSEMVCYPFVFEHKKNKYMLYNGNQYGKDGFGLAKLEK